MSEFSGPAGFSNWTTSKEAAESQDWSPKRRIVYQTLLRDGPRCIFEVMNKTGFCHQTASARLRELVRDGFCERLDGKKGRDCQIVVNPSTGKSQERVRALPVDERNDPEEKLDKVFILCKAIEELLKVPCVQGTQAAAWAQEAFILVGWDKK